MEEEKRTPETVEQYIAGYPSDIQLILEKVRRVIKEAAPDAEEKISYRMPTYALHGNLVHYAAHKNHIGFYPTPSAIEAFTAELSEYKGAKGSVQFPLDKPIPYELIERIVKYRVAENIGKAKLKRKPR